MRIDGVNGLTQVYSNKMTKPVQKAKQQNNDELNISTFAMEINKAKQLVKEVPDLRMDKIHAIQEQMRTGTYTIHAEEVAQRIVSEFDMKG